MRADDPIEKLINSTSFGYEFFLVSEALQLLGIRTVGDLSKLDPKRLFKNPSLTRQRAERLLRVLEKWRQLPLVKELNEHWSQPKFLKESVLQPPLAEEDQKIGKIPPQMSQTPPPKASEGPFQESRESTKQHDESLFSHIDPKSDEQAIHAAVLVIVKRLQALPAPRSLCEIGASDEDSRWLCTWAWGVRPQTAYRWLAASWPGISGGADAGGSLLLLLAAEVARRQAQEGYV